MIIDYMCMYMEIHIKLLSLKATYYWKNESCE